MRANNLISVIIPAKNRLEFTREALRSVFDQPLPGSVVLEVIVVDNRSDPPLEKAISKEFPKARVIRNDRFDSPGGSRNAGLSVAKGAFVAFLDNDDKWRRGFLKESMLAFKGLDVPATVCFTRPYFYGAFSLKRKIKLVFLNLVRALFLLVFWISNSKRLPKSGFYLCQISHMVFRRESIKKLRFNETAAAAEDWEFNVGVTLENPIVIIPKALVDFRYESGSNTFSDRVREGKERAYYDLLKRLPKTHRKGFLNVLFRWYIKSLLVK